MKDAERNKLIEAVRANSLDVIELCLSAVRYSRTSLDGLTLAKKKLQAAIDASAELDAE